MANKTTPATTVIPPNAGGSNKSTPAPKVAVPAGIKKWLWLAAVAVAVIVGIALLVASVKRDRAKVAQRSVQTPAQVNVLAMTAGGDSPHVSAPPGHSVSFFGSGFTTHCVYTDGREGIVGDSKNPCASGPMLYQFVRDTTGKPNSVTYVFNKVL